MYAKTVIFDFETHVRHAIMTSRRLHWV